MPLTGSRSEKEFFKRADFAESFRVVKDQQVFGEFVMVSEVNLLQSFGNLVSRRRMETRTSKGET